MTYDIDPEAVRPPYKPPECRFPGCDEPARSIVHTTCSQKHDNALQQAAAELLFGQEGYYTPEEWEEMCHQKLEAIENAPKWSPEMMQRRINELSDCS